MPKGTNQKLKLYYLSRIMMEKTEDEHHITMPEDIGKVSKADTILVVPEKMAAKAREVSGMVGKIETVKPSVYREMGGLEFETVSAYNTLKPFHPKSAEWVGYILRIDNKRIYIAGYTDATKEAKAVNCRECNGSDQGGV